MLLTLLEEKQVAKCNMEDEDLLIVFVVEEEDATATEGKRRAPLVVVN